MPAPDRFILDSGGGILMAADDGDENRVAIGTLVITSNGGWIIVSSEGPGYAPQSHRATVKFKAQTRHLLS